MQKNTRSILEELDALYNERDRKHVLENRASHLIESAIRLLESIDKQYDKDRAEVLQRKLLNAIKMRDPSKFTKSIRRADQDKTDNENS